MPESELMTSLAKALPDTPRYIETRSMLLANRGEVLGWQAAETPSFVIRHTEIDLIAVIGKPVPQAIRQAVAANEDRGAVLAFDDNFDWVREGLPEWRSEKAILHLLKDHPVELELPSERVRFLQQSEIESLNDLPDELKRELLVASRHTPVLATIADEKPVAFCYAGAITETLWDVSIDTLDGYRQRGYAGQCVRFLITHFDKQGKRPVWGAVESNEASMKLAAKLGFQPVDELFVFER